MRANHPHTFVQAINTSKGNSIIARRVHWAGTSAERRQGLLKRDRLETDEGIYIIPTQWIHTFGMRFHIDVAYLDRTGRVLSIHHGLRPNRLAKLCIRAEGALELAAGRLAATETELNDIITFHDL